jgi:hypothetical protein
MADFPIEVRNFIAQAQIACASLAADNVFPDTWLTDCSALSRVERAFILRLRPDGLLRTNGVALGTPAIKLWCMACARSSV